MRGAAGGLVVAPAILHTKPESTFDWESAKKDVPPLPACSLADTAGCTVVHGSGQHILLLGDSNARMYIPTFQKIAEKEGLTLSVAAGPLCPWQQGLFYLIGDASAGPSTPTGMAAWWTH